MTPLCPLLPRLGNLTRRGPRRAARARHSHRRLAGHTQLDWPRRQHALVRHKGGGWARHLPIAKICLQQLRTITLLCKEIRVLLHDNDDVHFFSCGLGNSWLP